MKPFSQACENNKKPILEVLERQFAKARIILEIGSGTGQHGIFFAEKLPGIYWHTSDQTKHHHGINLWIESASLENIGRPLLLDVLQDNHWQDIYQNTALEIDGVFSANTAHIMPWTGVVEMFRGVGRLLKENAPFVLYGPFNRSGAYTSESNRNFDRQLQYQDPKMGIRDDVALVELASVNLMSLSEDIPMPANNRILVFCKNDQ